MSTPNNPIENPGQPGFAGSNLPQYSGAPAGFGQQPQPQLSESGSKKIQWAFILTLVAAAVMAISSLLSVRALTTPEGKNAVLEQSGGLEGSGLTQEQFDAAISIGVGLAIVFAVVIIGLAVLAALNLMKHKNWARIVLAVITGLSILSALSNPVNFIIAGLFLAATVLVFMQDAGEYFKKRVQY